MLGVVEDFNAVWTALKSFQFPFKMRKPHGRELYPQAETTSRVLGTRVRSCSNLKVPGDASLSPPPPLTLLPSPPNYPEVP